MNKNKIGKKALQKIRTVAWQEYMEVSVRKEHMELIPWALEPSPHYVAMEQNHFPQSLSLDIESYMLELEGDFEFPVEILPQWFQH